MSFIVDIHALQTIPPSLINRDDTGAPKTAIFGGVPRQRVSSQSWKRAMRRYIEENVDSKLIGRRSKRLPGEIAKRIHDLEPDWSDERITEGLQNLFKPTKIKLIASDKVNVVEEDGQEQLGSYPETSYLLFLSPTQITRAAEAIIEKNGEKFPKKEAAEILDTEHSFDIAMFGRMLADAPSFNVDASVQVAHAIGVHESQPEFDYFTAVDDVVEDEDESGAGMIGTVQMMSSTLYRYATVNMAGLEDNLGDYEAAIKCAVAFVGAFIQSMPTGKQNTFANNTLPELVYVAVREGRSISLVNAFEEPVAAQDGRSRRENAAKALADEARNVRDTYGFKNNAGFVLALGNMKDIFADLAETVKLSELNEKLAAALVVNE